MTIIERPLPKPESVLVDPAASHWLKDAFGTALMRDPVDALNDAELLCEFLELRLKIHNSFFESPKEDQK